jgi:hypothetical protein
MTFYSITYKKKRTLRYASLHADSTNEALEMARKSQVHADYGREGFDLYGISAFHPLPEYTPKVEAFLALQALRSVIDNFRRTKYRVKSDRDKVKKEFARVRKLMHPWERNAYAAINGKPNKLNYFWSKV